MIIIYPDIPGLWVGSCLSADGSSPHVNIRNSIDLIVNKLGPLKLRQMNRFKNECGNILDLVFTDFIKCEVSVCVDPILPCDLFHNALVINIQGTHYDSLKFDFCIFDFQKTNYENVNVKLKNINWTRLFNGCDTENSSVNLYTELNQVISEEVPLKTVKSSSFPRWFSTELVKAIILKKKLHRIYSAFKTEFNYQRFKEQRSLVKKLNERDYKKFIAKTEKSIAEDPMGFYKFVNGSKGREGIPSSMSLDLETGTGGKDIANLFATFFGSVFKDKKLSSNNCKDNGYGVLPDFFITEREVMTALESLAVDTSPGPDGIHPMFAKLCKDTLAFPLCLLFYKSISEGVFPSMWKDSFITPIFKSGDKTDVRNYRPITILSVFPKIFDLIVFNKISAHIHSQIIDKQHGFMPKRSTVTNLSIFVEHVIQSFALNSETHAIYMDIVKAFDSVNFDLLLIKLRAFGLNEGMIKWFRSYLYGRKQRVKIRNFRSFVIFVLSGVPQGSHLGPLLFLVFVNDISDVIRFASFLLFADDFKMYFRIDSKTDVANFSEDLLRVVTWFKQNGLEPHVKKCACMIYCNRSYDVVNYEIDGVKLDSPEFIRDLGVWFDPKLLFKKHYDVTVSKAFNKLFFILRRSKDFT